MKMVIATAHSLKIVKKIYANNAVSKDVKFAQTQLLRAKSVLMIVLVIMEHAFSALKDNNSIPMDIVILVQFWDAWLA